MKAFKYFTPTEVVFGPESEQKIGKLVKKYGGTRVLIHYGGKSAERSGLLDVVRQSLDAEGIRYVELGGVVPNPRVSLVRRGIEVCRQEKVDFLLAVGGGSVIDSLKAISVGVPYEGDVWDFYEGLVSRKECLPLGCVLTIPAAGSEMSNGSVITNEEGNLKRSYGMDEFRCRFAVMNPVRTYTLPAWQTACGATDMIMHIMERYFTNEDDMDVTSGIAESLMRTVMDYAPRVLKEPTNYHYRAQIMWAGSLAHNGLCGCGVTEDWATHQLEHELSAIFDVSHGAGLAAVWGSWARYVLPTNPTRFARYAVNVMGVSNNFKNPTETALRGIEKTEQFFQSIGMPTDIHSLIGREITEEEIVTMAAKCSHNGTETIGGLQALTYQDMIAIYQMAK